MRTHLLLNYIRAGTVLALIFGMYSEVPAIDKAGWHKEYNDTLHGINLFKAIRFLESRNIEPSATVVVGIIDSGVDTTTIDLTPALWTNPGERIDGRDNDGNGYIDDLHGWNFLGTKDGSFNMTSAGTEEYREFKRLYPKYKNVERESAADKAEYDYYVRMRQKAGINGYMKMAAYTALKDECYALIDSVARVVFRETLDTITVSNLASGLPDDERLEAAFQPLLADIMRAKRGVTWNELYNTHKNGFALMKKRLHGIEHDADKRLLMGDDLKNPDDVYYGNTCLQVEGCEHGTFVAGIIAGQGIKEPSCSGVYPAARLMILRAAPDGDEYDKDVATAIRYAVDNGAKVINMSIGKMTSPDSAMVSDAVGYALQHDVLLLQAAGNSHMNIDSVPYFPTGKNPEGVFYDNYIRVGASDKDGNPASMSNFGVREVDVFAPGVAIRSNTVGNEYMEADGTSVATPVASAVAAMLRAYFPRLKASQVKDILVRSSRPEVPLNGKCRSGGIVDAYRAVKMIVDNNK